ncbi:MAG: beta-lactamase family protein [Planctomycetales bacterium]|nr:beta-lactamase family protein [Planctomycetales bacterium]
MELDKYQQAWKSSAARTEVKIDTELLAKAVRESHLGFQSTINWRDFREVGIGLLLLIYWVYKGLASSMPWAWWLGVPALTWVVGFILVDRKRHPQRPSASGEPLNFYAKEALSQVEHQIWLLRNVIWWYLLPLGISAMAFFIQVSWNTSSSWWGFALQVFFLSLFVFVLYWGIYWLNQFAVRKDLEPRRQDLLKLVASLESESSGEESDEVVDLLTVFNDRANNCRFGSEAWVANWNRIVPSWRVAMAIIVPTLAGAACGLFCGLILRIPEMGPVFFQTVVGAVIPFEIVFFTFVYLSHRRKQQLESASTGIDDTKLVIRVTESSAEGQQFKRLPKAPALVILVLTIAMGVLAILALFSFSMFESFGNGSPFDRSRVLGDPDFGDVSELNSSDVASLDSWLQRQVELANYPSLAVAIVRDGETVYGRAFGFEDIATSKPATLQTQYHVASVTKVFTASLAVMLQKQGVIVLDDPVAKYLPGNVAISASPETGATITLRQLASHTSGLPRDVPGPVQSVDAWYELEPQRLYDLLASVKLESEPGEKERYSNLGFGLLGHALERAADKPLDRLVKEMICDPLQLDRTSIPIDDTIHPATGYDDSGRQREKKASFRERLAGSGGLVTTAEDLAKFIAAQMQPGVFSSEMLQELHTRTSLLSETLADTSLGWSFKFNDRLGPYPEKNGGRSNCSAWIGFVPDHNVGVIVVTNCGGPKVDPIGRILLERSTPRADKPVTELGYAKVAPFTGVRWEGDRPIVRVSDQWSPLVSIDGIPIDRLMKFADDEFGSLARKRFAEDLVEVLSKYGHEPGWTVILVLEQANGIVEEKQVLMTKANRDQVWEDNRNQ